jgi:DNA replication and repair protein RecF
VELASLRIAGLRLFERLDIAFEPGWNLFVGANGAGKTTILEAAYLLSHGRSFRAGSRDALVREGEAGFSIYGEFSGTGSRRGLGIARQNGRVEARVNGVASTLGDLMQHAAVLCFEPGSHDLLSGTSEGRRRFLDWGVFHVEHDFLTTWLRYQRALRQRNALLRQGASDTELEPWSLELARSGEPLTAMRRRYFAALAVAAEPLLALLLPELGTPRLEFSAGHDTGQPLFDELIARQSRDRERGHGTRDRIAPTGRLRSSARRAVNTCRAGRRSSERSRWSWRRRAATNPTTAMRLCFASTISPPRSMPTISLACSTSSAAAARRSSPPRRNGRPPTMA